MSDLELLSTHKSVLGYLLLTRAPTQTGVSIVRQSGTIFEGDSGRRYAAAISKMVDSVQGALDEIGGEDVSTQDHVRFLRIRTKRHEIIISPDDNYLLAVLHDPAP